MPFIWNVLLNFISSSIFVLFSLLFINEINLLSLNDIGDNVVKVNGSELNSSLYNITF